jgi:hypothetical protein
VTGLSEPLSLPRRARQPQADPAAEEQTPVLESGDGTPGRPHAVAHLTRPPTPPLLPAAPAASTTDTPITGNPRPGGSLAALRRWQHPVRSGIIRRTIQFNYTKPAKGGETTAEELVGRLGPKAKQRYRELADHPTLDFVFHSLDTLAEYCETGAVHLVHAYERERTTAPSNQLPAPKLGSGSKYESSRTNMPNTMDWEQTPTHFAGPRQAVQVRGKEPLDALAKNLAASRQKDSGMKVDTRATTNVFQYELQLTFRATPMAHDERGWREVIEKEINGIEVSATSPMYQSSGKAMTLGNTSAQTSNRSTLKESEINAEVRRGVTQAAALGLQFEQFEPTLPYAKQLRGGKLDLTKAEELDSTVKGGYSIPSGSLSSLCFHSETQALGATERELPPIMTELMQKMLAAVKTLPPPFTLVFNSLQVLGASNPNTVCGNACKPALAKLLDTIYERFEAELAARRADLEKQGIVTRNSQFFAAHMSVDAPEEFGGYGTGAKKIDLFTRPRHLVVTEFPPRIMMADNPKLKARKEKAAEKKAQVKAKSETSMDIDGAPQSGKVSASGKSLSGPASKHQKKDHS